MTLGSRAALVLLTAFCGLRCAVSDPLDLPVADVSVADAAAGSGGNAGVSGSAGSLGTAGVSGAAGSIGTAGTGPGGGTGGAGTSGNGLTGTAGRGGGTGAGRGGTTGAAGTFGAAGTGGGNSSDGGTVTFTQVYADVISKYCFGSGCHNPAGGDRPSFASQAACYSFFKGQGQLYPGKDPNTSYIYFIMHGDPTASPPSPPYMPPTPNANVSAADLAIVAAWIADGALND